MNIAIIDDDRSIRKMLKKIIETEKIGHVIFEADNGSYVEHEDFKIDDVDVILTDFIMPVKSGIEAIKELLALNYKGILVMLSQVQDKTLVGEAYSLGIDYYINKPINYIEVVSILGKIKEKQHLQQLVEEHRRSEFSARLTPAEFKILLYISHELSQAQIADKLFISIQTVKNHISQILKKTGTHSSKEAARKAKEMKLI